MKVQQSLFKSTFLLINAFKNKDTSKLHFEISIKTKYELSIYVDFTF